MTKNRLLVICLLLPAMISCETKPSRPPIADVTNQMLGMSRDEINICIGQPAKKSTDSMGDVWSYTYGACTVNLSVADDQVNAVTYTLAAPGPDDGDLTDDEQCGHVPVVISCVRWLRH